MKNIKPKPKKKYSPDSHNIVRRKRYDDDGEYREEIKSRARTSYRKLVGKELENCLRSLAFFEELSSVQRVRFPNGDLYDCPVMNIPTTAKVLQKIYQTVWRWIRDDMLPSPILEINGTSKGVYHVEEVRVFIEVLGEHEKLFAYYRNDHVTTKEELFRRTRLVREELEKS